MQLYYRSLRRMNMISALPRRGMASTAQTVLVLGAAGTFGRFVCESLAKENNMRLVIAGRKLSVLSSLAHQLKRSNPHAQIDVRPTDVFSPSFKKDLAASGAGIVINTVGPFQEQGYDVAKACIDNSMNYIDLADDRSFVVGISALDEQAKAKGVLVASGASSVPALSAAVIDDNLQHFARLQSVVTTIAPGNKAPRGLATIKSVLSYYGHRFPVLHTGSRTDVVGWGDLHARSFRGLGSTRIVGNCNIPDLALLPPRYRGAGVQSVRFYAGLELPLFMFGFDIMRRLVQAGRVRNMARYGAVLQTISDWFLPLGTDEGAMSVVLQGLDADRRPLLVEWSLVAASGHGPRIPSLASIILAKKLAGILPNGPNLDLSPGARACMGMISSAEFTQAMREFDIVTHTDIRRQATASQLASFTDLALCSSAMTPSASSPGGPFAKELALGSQAWSKLPAFMRRFESTGGRVEGSLAVVRGTGLLANLAADLGRLPKATPADKPAHVTVNTSVSDGQEVWHRMFDGRPMNSKFSFRNGLAVEHFGPLAFGFHLKPIDDGARGFEMIFKRLWLLGIPIPRVLAQLMRPAATQRAHADGRGWDVFVRLEMAAVGLIVQYKGAVRQAD